MSKIAEKKALEEYPKVNPPYHTSVEAQVNVEHAYKREGYIQGYDQAMQDFLEKACDYLQKNLWRIIIEDGEFRQRFVTDFKNYMEK